MPGVYLLTHSLTTSTPTSSPCTLLTLCSSNGFGAGAYSAAVAALMAYRPPSRAEYSKFDCVLTCLGGIAMPPQIFQELLNVYYAAHSLQLQLANDSSAQGHVHDDSSFTHSLRIVQHVHDRVSPWSLNEILLNYGRTKLVVEEKVWRAAGRGKQARRSSTAEKVPRVYSGVHTKNGREG